MEAKRTLFTITLAAAAGLASTAALGAEVLYRDAWSANEMLGAQVRGERGEDIGEVKDLIVARDGKLAKVVVEVGGFLDIGDQHIGVPWRDVSIGPDMEWVQVPLQKARGGEYSLYDVTPIGESVSAGHGAWRVNELIGDYASLRDVPRYGMVSDVIFGADGQARGVVVSRPAGAWGRAGWYGYPYADYDGRSPTYALPYDRQQLAGQRTVSEGFDYLTLGELSRFSGADK